MYSFSENSGGSSQNGKPYFSNFFCKNAYYYFCDISEITAPLCLKFRTEVTSHVLDPTLYVSLEWVSPIGIYDHFPKVTYYRTVQNSEVVRHATCHWFIFRFGNSDHRKYSPCSFWNIFRNSIWTSVAHATAILPRCPV